MLKMNHISKIFPGVKALDDISIEIGQGEIHGLVGENGAGKSTLMKILSGAYTLDEGEILIDGERISNTSPARTGPLAGAAWGAGGVGSRACRTPCQAEAVQQGCVPSSLQ